MLDYHTHILPGMDDGCRTVEESVKVLKLMKESGVSVVMLTPHYYSDKEGVDDFLKRRQASYERLLHKINGEDVPKLVLGAEFSFSRYVSDVENIAELCYEGTNYLLLELPFEKWDTFTYDQMQNLGVKHGVIPVIAHFDRYMKYGNKFEDIYSFECPVQLSANAFEKPFKRRKWLSCIKENIDIVLGSDCHNLTSRPPNLHIADKIIREKIGDNVANRIDSVGRTMLGMDIELK